MNRYLTLSLVLVFSATAGAQVTWDGNSISSAYSPNSADRDIEWGGSAVVSTVTQLSNGINLTYDATVLPKYPLSDPNLAVHWNLWAAGSFTVGPVPVDATMTMRRNGKLVNGGGSTDKPTTNLYWGAMLYYDLDESHTWSAPDVPVPTFVVNSSKEISGNGLLVIDDTVAMTAAYILSPEYSYVVTYSQSLHMSDLSSTPSSATFEGGGATAYDGMTITFDFTPVPEPATLSMLAMGSLTLLRRRRRG